MASDGRILPLEEQAKIWLEQEVEYGKEIGTVFLEFDGVCPFLGCLETEPHKHPVCPACGATRFGNISCDVCNELAKRKYGER